MHWQLRSIERATGLKGRIVRSDCRHECCAIRTVGYHTHQSPPSDCPLCVDALVAAGESPKDVTLSRVVADVLARVAPEIPGLPDGPELADLVGEHACAEYADAIGDRAWLSLPARDRRSALAGRVGLALSFPELFLSRSRR